MAYEIILSKQTVSGFTFDRAKGAYKASLSRAFTLTAGQYYEIGWDGKTYTRKAYTLNGDSTVYIGNELRQKGEIDDITEPFIIVYVPGTNQNLFYAYDTINSHIVGISTAEEPNSVLVKDWHGKEHEFTGYDTVYIRNRNGDAQPYTHGLLGSDIETAVNFSKGSMALSSEDGDFVKKVTVQKPDTLIPENIAEGVDVAGIVGALSVPIILEDLPIELDFSGGNQSIAAPDGYAVKTATIQQPANLTPANIAEGVDIAGIIGTLAAGGVSAKIDIFTIPYRASARAINHNLGVVPDMIFLLPSSATNGSTAGTRYLAAFGVSAKFAQEYSVPVKGSNVYYYSSKWYTKTYTTPIDQATSVSDNFIYNASANSFYLTSYNIGMVCIAIGGLT